MIWQRMKEWTGLFILHLWRWLDCMISSRWQMNYTCDDDKRAKLHGSAQLQSNTHRGGTDNGQTPTWGRGKKREERRGYKTLGPLVHFRLHSVSAFALSLCFCFVLLLCITPQPSIWQFAQREKQCRRHSCSYHINMLSVIALFFRTCWPLTKVFPGCVWCLCLPTTCLCDLWAEKSTAQALTHRKWRKRERQKWNQKKQLQRKMLCEVRGWGGGEFCAFTLANKQGSGDCSQQNKYLRQVEGVTLKMCHIYLSVCCRCQMRLETFRLNAGRQTLSSFHSNSF